jgi:hypothetical protein
MGEIQCNCNGPLCAFCGPKYQQATIQPGKKYRISYGGVMFETPEPEVEKLRTENAALRKEVEGLRYRIAVEMDCVCTFDDDVSSCVFDDGDVTDCKYARALIEKCKDKVDCPLWQPARGKG